jgi:L-malate glycosyltransferase
MLGCNSGWVPNPMEILAPLLEIRGWECRLTSSNPYRFSRLADILSTVWRLRNWTDVLCIQVYSGRSFVVEDLVSRLGKRLGLRIVMMLHGGSMPDFMRKFPQWSVAVLGRADTIITPSIYLSNAITPYGFKSRVIPNLLELEKYPYRHREKVAPSLLWMRTFYPYYNPNLAVETLALIRAKYPQASLTMAGQDKGMLENVRLRTKQLGLNEAVRFPGFLNDHGKWQEFSKHDIFINTTNIDNMPICLLEAGASGLPIVSTRVGGVPDLVKDGESAILVSPEDPEAMAKGIIRILEEPGLSGILSKSGRRLAESCGADYVLPLWEAVFHEG